VDEQFIAQRRVRELPPVIASLSERLSQLGTDEHSANTHAAELTVIEGRAHPHKDVQAALSQALGRLPLDVLATTRVPLGTYRGLSFGLVRRPQFSPDLYLEGKAVRQSMLARDHAGPRAILNELERIADSYNTACAGVRRDLTVAEGQLRDYRANLGRPFGLEGYIADLTSLRNQLRIQLSETAHPTEAKGVPGISELAERIKTLKTANQVASAPQRVRQVNKASTQVAIFSSPGAA
jgi:hypothetical protein